MGGWAGVGNGAQANNEQNIEAGDDTMIIDTIDNRAKL